MAKFERTLSARASETARFLNDGLQAQGAVLVDSSAYRFGNVSAYMMLFDSFPGAAGAAMSLMVIGYIEGECNVNAITSHVSAQMQSDGSDPGALVERLTDELIARKNPVRFEGK